ncbi:chromobox protein-like 1-like [Gigaspora margarita]|uniref:Chromobox protein-like 1-like n=1 Tax=Gigaspora margarita TaxID=4874 RepID=A0A8H3XEC9_GIGMA|nr:chromobox protein-like 1-like [Gigaspora margarita]
MQRKNKRVVERIIDHKFINESVSYLVKWKGYPDEENSWKLQDEIIKYAELLEYYWESVENQPSSKSISKEISSSSSSMTTDPSKSIIENVNVKKKQKEGNKIDRNSEKHRLGNNIPRFYEPDWDLHVECIEAIFHGESNREVLAIIKWKSHKLQTLHSIEEVKRRCPQQIIRYYETRSHFKILKSY